GLGCAKTPAPAAHVETTRRNCAPWSRMMLRARCSTPCWRVVFSTFRRCMSFYKPGSSSTHAVEATRPCLSASPPKATFTDEDVMRRFAPIASHCAAIKSADFLRAISCDQFMHSADDSHGQRFSASAHVHLTRKKSIHSDAGSGSNNVGHDELTAIVFGQVLETSSNMHRIANCCQEEAIAVAKLA